MGLCVSEPIDTTQSAEGEAQNQTNTRTPNRPPGSATPQSTYVQCPKCYQTLMAQVGVVNMCPCGQRFMAPAASAANGDGSQTQVSPQAAIGGGSPSPPTHTDPLGPLSPGERRTALLAEQTRFEHEVAATRQRRQAERIVQVQCPGCEQILSAKTGELLRSMGMMRCGDCSATFQVQLPSHLQDSLALPPGQRVGRQTSVRTICPQCSSHLMALPGTINMCMRCGQQFMMQAAPPIRQSQERPHESLPLSAVPAAEARPHRAPDVSFGAPRGWGFLHAAHEFKLRVKNEHAAIRWVRAADKESKIHWIEYSQLHNPKSAQLPPVDDPISWVPVQGLNAAKWQVRSDDMHLAAKFGGVRMLELSSLPLEDKNQWFRHFLEPYMIPAEAPEGPIRLEIMRTGMLEHARDRFLALEPQEFSRTFRYRMQRETDFYQDVGGVTREVYMLFTEAFFSPIVGLFTSAPCEEVSYVIDPTSGTAAETLEFFRFTGRVFGKALIDGYNMSARLSPPMLKHLLRIPVTADDLKTFDPTMHNSLMWAKHNPIEDAVFETFTVPLAGSDSDQVAELMKDGGEVTVTDENKEEWIELKAKWYMETSFQPQLQALCEGFWEVVPECDKTLSIFSVEEFDLLLSGHSELDVIEWKQYTQYTGDYKESSPVVGWFWGAVEKFSAEDRGKLLQFATGSSRVPVGGFKALQSAKGKSCMFTLAIDPNCSCTIPRSHTCFNRIDIPEYTDGTTIEKHLRMVIEMETLGFMMEE